MSNKRAREAPPGGRKSLLPAADLDKVLAPVRALIAREKEAAKRGSAKPTLAQLGITNVREVTELPPPVLLDTLEDVLAGVADSIMGGSGFAYDVPSRTSSNTLYIPELDRIVLKDATSSRPFTSVTSVRKTTIMTRVMQLLYDVLRKGIHVTKRDLFYTDV